MIELYADGADFETMKKLNCDPDIRGFTTNPTLMKQAGVTDYEKFANELLATITEKPISFEVIADEQEEMNSQARILNLLGKNVYVKIPIMNTKGYYNLTLMRALSEFGIKVNATAITEYSQISDVIRMLDTDTPSIISIFAGRIADTGRNPCHYVEHGAIRRRANQKILWASTREVYNIVEAEKCGADIITVTPAILAKKNKMFGRNLVAVSKDTVQQFYNDAKESGLKIRLW